MDTKEAEILRKYLPEPSLAYCLHFWTEYRIQLTISRPRTSVFGNYSFRNGVHRISVNGNLSKEAFLVTYLHEVAHLLVQVRYPGNRRPHGPLWKMAFHEVMQPVLVPEIFADTLRYALIRHLQNPPASSCSDPALHALLGKASPEVYGMEGSHKPVRELEAGQYFRFREKVYQLEKTNRTRLVARQLLSERRYSFPRETGVEPVAVHDIPAGMLPDPGQLRVRDIGPGTSFRYRHQRFELIRHLRTQAFCRNMETNLLYRMAGDMAIEPAESAG